MLCVDQTRGLPRTGNEAVHTVLQYVCTRYSYVVRRPHGGAGHRAPQPLKFRVVRVLEYVAFSRSVPFNRVVANGFRGVPR